MANVKIGKVSSADAPRDADGEIGLARGERIAMRMWLNEAADASKPSTTRPYETVGFVLSGRAELHIDDQVVKLAEGDSWAVPAGASHRYVILEDFSAVEAISL